MRARSRGCRRRLIAPAQASGNSYLSRLDCWRHNAVVVNAATDRGGCSMANGLMAALDGTMEPLPHTPSPPDELTEMVQLGIRAWNKEIEDQERAWRVDHYIREFRASHGPELDRLQRPLNKKVLERYSKAFDDFQRWARKDNVQGLPVHAAVAAAYLAVLMLAEKPMREIKEAAAAIEYYHKFSEFSFDT